MSLEDLAKKAEEGFEKVVDAAKEKAEEAKDKLAELAGDAKDKAEDAKDKVEEAAEDAKDKAEEIAEDVKDKAEDVKESSRSEPPEGGRTSWFAPLLHALAPPTVLHSPVARTTRLATSALLSSLAHARQDAAAQRNGRLGGNDDEHDAHNR